MSLYQKIANVTKKTGAILKAGTNEGQRYNYVRWKETAEMVRSVAAEEGLALTTSVYDEQHSLGVEKDKYGNDKPVYWSFVKLALHLSDSDDEKSTHTIYSHGAAKDYGDKAVYKATTGALKYALRQAFLLPDTGDDPEGDSSVDPEPEPKQAPKSYKAPQQQQQSAAGSFKRHTPPASSPVPSAEKPAQTQQTASVPDATASLSKSSLTNSSDNVSRFGAPSTSNGKAAETTSSDPVFHVERESVVAFIKELKATGVSVDEAKARLLEKAAPYGVTDLKAIPITKWGAIQDAVRQRDLL